MKNTVNVNHRTRLLLVFHEFLNHDNARNKQRKNTTGQLREYRHSHHKPLLKGGNEFLSAFSTHCTMLLLTVCFVKVALGGGVGRASY
jgi:hypothetical protein